MILTGPEIIKQVEAGKIHIDPFSVDRVNPNSYDCLLGDELAAYEECQLFKPNPKYLDVNERNKVCKVPFKDGAAYLMPGVLYLGTTVEIINSDHYVSFVEGKSSLGRLGLSAHVCAGFVDCGFRGNITLEITVVQPLKIYSGMRICQILFSEIVGEKQLYKGKYQDQRGVVESRSWYTRINPK